jgi:hypothetical protein
MQIFIKRITAKLEIKQEKEMLVKIVWNILFTYIYLNTSKGRNYYLKWEGNGQTNLKEKERWSLRKHFSHMW